MDVVELVNTMRTSLECWRQMSEMSEVVLGSWGCRGGLTAWGDNRGTAGFSSLGNTEGDSAAGLSV